MSGIVSYFPSVLYVGEDEATVREATREHTVGRNEADVTCVEGSETPREHLADETIDCLVVEAETAGGIELVAECDQERPDMPTLVVLDDEARVDEALAAGASDVFVRRSGVDDTALLARRLDSLLRSTSEGKLDELRRKKYFSDLLLDTLDDVFYLVEPDGTLGRWNEQLPSVLGYSDEELDGMDVLTLFEDDDREKVAEGIAETLETGSASVEAAFVTRDGEAIPYEFTGAKLTDPDGELRGLVGIGRDISEQQALEQELRRKASLLDHIFDQVPAALYVKDTEGRHLRMSSYYSDPDEAIGKTDPEVYGENEYTEATFADDMRVIEEGEQIINKEEYDPVGEEWTITSKVPWHDEDGDVQGLIGVSRLITEKKEYERKLNLRNRAMEEAPIGITIHDVRGSEPEIIYANSSFEALTGYDRDAVNGRTLGFLRGADTDSEQFEALATAFAEGETTSVVVVLYRDDGTPFWGQINVAPVTDETGELTHFVGFLQDVTETKEHAEELERQLDEFGELIGQELRAPLHEAETAVRVLDGPEGAVDDAVDSIERVDKLIEDLVTVHSFSVKSREVLGSESGKPGGRG